MLSAERVAEIRKIAACVPFITPEAGCEETTLAFRDLLREYSEALRLLAEAAHSMDRCGLLSHADRIRVFLAGDKPKCNPPPKCPVPTNPQCDCPECKQIE